MSVPVSGNLVVSDDDLKALKAGTKYLVVFGQIEYEDQFGRHWTRFCDWRTYHQGVGTFEALPCVTYNGVGDGKLSEK